MNDDFVSLYAYNRWADRLMLDACRKLTPQQYAQEPVPGWSSVRSSIWHIAVVADGWLRAVAEESADTVPTEKDLATPDDAERLLDKAYQRFQRLAPSLTPERLSTPQTFRRRTRTAVLPPWAVLRHIVNHSTYHRGQVSSKLKRLGIEPPAMDFVYWMLEQTPKP